MILMPIISTLTFLENKKNTSKLKLLSKKRSMLLHDPAAILLTMDDAMMPGKVLRK